MAKAAKGVQGSNTAKGSSAMWSMMSKMSALGAAAVAHKALDAGWRYSTRGKPPANPENPNVSLREAVTWTAATGAGVALARMYAQRRAAAYYVKSVGDLPPQLKKKKKH